MKQVQRGSKAKIVRSQSLVISGTMASVAKRKRTVEDNMCVISVKGQDIGGKSVASQPELDPLLKRPKYLQWTIWADPGVSSSISPTVCSTN